METDALSFDAVIVGAGPAGLCAAIRLKQKAAAYDTTVSVCVLEKGPHVGAHILSGALLETEVLDQLLPHWKNDPSFPPFTFVQEEQFLYFSKSHSFSLPTPYHNTGNIIISLGRLCHWLSAQAQALGVEIYAGFPAQQLLIREGTVVGIKTSDQGIDKAGEHGPLFQKGVEIYAQSTFLAEGCRGHLSQQAIQTFELQKSPQTYGLGLKEIWRVRSDLHKPGKIIHGIGWPLPTDTYGGSFIYHAENQTIILGLVVGLDYSNPFLDPYEELQQFKTHPHIRPLLEGGERLHYGARALNEGGWQSVPTLDFPGGMLIGCAAGFVNVAKIKGIKNAMYSGVLAAESYADQVFLSSTLAPTYDMRMRSSTVMQELHQVRNIRPAFRKGLYLGMAYAALELYFLKGKAPWTFAHSYDHLCLKLAKKSKARQYSAHDGVLTFDKMSSVTLTGTHHRENSACHLILNKPQLAIDCNWKKYASPEQHYCPAGVYEITQTDTGPQLLIHHTNCIHCKTCDIKDPQQNITWTSPEGGGPQYGKM